MKISICNSTSHLNIKIYNLFSYFLWTRLTVACKKKKSYIDIFCFMLLPGMPHLKCKTNLTGIQDLTYSRLKLENPQQWLSNTSLSNSRKKYQPRVKCATLRRHKFHSTFQKSLPENKCFKSREKHSAHFSLKRFSEVFVRWKL